MKIDGVRFAVLALMGIVALAGCDSTVSMGGVGGEGSLDLRLLADSDGGGPLAKLIVQSKTSPEDVLLVDCATPEQGEMPQNFCDELLVVPPGVYDIDVRPTNMECQAEHGLYTVLVREGETTEVSIRLICGGGNGALDVTVETLHRPVIQARSLAFASGGASGDVLCQGACAEDLVVEHQVTDPDTNCTDLVAQWSVADGSGAEVPGLLLAQETEPTGEICLFRALVDTAAPAGAYEVAFAVVDQDGLSDEAIMTVHFVECGDDLYQSNLRTVTGQYGDAGFASSDVAWIHADPSRGPATGGPATVDDTLDAGAVLEVQLLVSDDGTSWHDADAPAGPLFEAGALVFSRLVVTNHGAATLTGVTVHHDASGPDPVLEVASLDPGASESLVLDGPCLAGQVAALATATADGGTHVDSDPAHYFGEIRRDVGFEVYASVDDGVTWLQADAWPGAYLSPGTLPKLRYRLFNHGSASLTDVVVLDDSLAAMTAGVLSLAPGTSSEWYETGPDPFACD